MDVNMQSTPGDADVDVRSVAEALTHLIMAIPEEAPSAVPEVKPSMSIAKQHRKCLASTCNSPAKCNVKPGLVYKGTELRGVVCRAHNESLRRHFQIDAKKSHVKCRNGHCSRSCAVMLDSMLQGMTMGIVPAPRPAGRPRASSAEAVVVAPARSYNTRRRSVSATSGAELGLDRCTNCFGVGHTLAGCVHPGGGVYYARMAEMGQASYSAPWQAAKAGCTADAGCSPMAVVTPGSKPTQVKRMRELDDVEVVAAPGSGSVTVSCQPTAVARAAPGTQQPPLKRARQRAPSDESVTRFAADRIAMGVMFSPTS